MPLELDVLSVASYTGGYFGRTWKHEANPEL